MKDWLERDKKSNRHRQSVSDAIKILAVIRRKMAMEHPDTFEQAYTIVSKFHQEEASLVDKEIRTENLQAKNRQTIMKYIDLKKNQSKH